jgi:hypothetical protein
MARQWKRMTQCLSYTHQPIDRSDFGQHMRRIRPLFATRFEPTAFLEESEHGRQKLFLSMPGDQTCAELTQHRGIKAGVSELQAKRILHINTPPHCISGLSV